MHTEDLLFYSIHNKSYLRVDKNIDTNTNTHTKNEKSLINL